MDKNKLASRLAKDIGKFSDNFDDGDVIVFEKGYKKTRKAFREVGGYSISTREVFVEEVETVKYYTFAALKAGGKWYVTGTVAGNSDGLSYAELVETYLADELTRNIVIASDWVDVDI